MTERLLITRSAEGGSPPRSARFVHLRRTRTCYADRLVCARFAFLIIFLLNGFQENIYLLCVANNFKSVFVLKFSKNLPFANRT